MRWFESSHSSLTPQGRYLTAAQALAAERTLIEGPSLVVGAAVEDFVRWRPA